MAAPLFPGSTISKRHTTLRNATVSMPMCIIIGTTIGAINTGRSQR